MTLYEREHEINVLISKASEVGTFRQLLVNRLYGKVKCSKEREVVSVI